MAKFRPYLGSRYVRKTQNASAQALQAQFRQEVGEILDAFSDFVSDFEDIVPEVLVDVLEPTFGKALEYCPKDSGALEASGYLEVESRRGKHEIAIGFGRGGQPDYAIFVHEMPFRHEEPTRSKFLQTALDEDYYQMLMEVPRQLRARAGT